MAGDNPVDVGQADSVAFKIFQGVEALEDAKELAGVLHIKADTVILDKELGFSVFLTGADFYFSNLLRPGIFDGSDRHGRIAPDVFGGLRVALVICGSIH